MAIAPNLSSREGFVEAIKQAGLYIADHAENLLGEYPALLSELDITAHFRFDEPVTVELRRLHIACDKEDYPTQRPEPEMPEGYEFHRMGRGSNANG